MMCHERPKKFCLSKQYTVLLKQTFSVIQREQGAESKIVTFKDHVM